MHAIEIRLPALSASATTAAVVAWRKAPGDRVTRGDVLLELETDKSSVDLEAEHEGVLLEILVPAGSEDVPVGALLARLAPGAREEAPVPGRLAAPVAAVSLATAAPAVAAHPDVATSLLATAPGVAPTGALALSRSAAPTGARTPSAPAVREAPRAGHATPLARRMAAQAGLALDALVGSGAGGRITKADVEASLGIARAGGEVIALSGPRVAPRPAAPANSASPAAAPAAFAPPPDTGAWRAERLSPARRRQAARLAESKRTIPHFYLSLDCDVERITALRSELAVSAKRAGEPAPSLNELVVRAVALALRRVPEANVSFAGDALRVYENVDVAVAVAGERGLVTPVVRDADRLGLGTLARALRDLTARARAGKLRPDEYQGGTTTVSNLGMFGVDALWPILNPPQATIFGIGAATPRAVVQDGAVVARTRATLTLSADHRALDGATGARLLAALRELLQDPLRLLL